MLGRGRPEHEGPAQFQRLHGVGGAVDLGTPQGEPPDVAGGGAGRRQGVPGAELEEDVGREQFQRRIFRPVSRSSVARLPPVTALVQ
ncbi:hypothetical protein [Streptomyces albidoflavus]|uniref:hypothetical protein n=1 Tax=Streptomyces albidoflavus TaxID=1886 RepID=UPI0020D191E0|nr:hypothetical protein [Streptomyces albidoflavus]